MGNAVRAAAIALAAFGVASWIRYLRWALGGGRVAADEPAARGPLAILLGRGELGSCGLLLAVLTAGAYGLLRASGLVLEGDPVGPAGAAALGLGIVASSAIVHAVLLLRRASERCADLEAALGATMGKIERLQRDQRYASLVLARTLREKEQAERELAEREAAAEAAELERAEAQRVAAVERPAAALGSTAAAAALRS